MTKQEIIQATRALHDLADRIETASDGASGQYLTAHWIDGGQKLFYSLSQVADHLDSVGDPGGAEALRAGAF